MRAFVFDMTFWPRRARYAARKWAYLIGHGWTLRRATIQAIGHVVEPYRWPI